MNVMHLARAIHLPGSEKRFLFMVYDLTSYMDETGHSDDPHFHFAGMAGFVAPAETWQKFGNAWQEVLDIFNLKEPFHMKDFAHSQGQFREWKGKETKRRLLFSTLVTLLTKSDFQPIGAIVSIEDFNTLSERQRQSFLDPYYIGFQTCTKGAALEGMGHEPEKVAMVYSYNKEYGATPAQEVYSVDQAGRAEQLWHTMKRSTTYGKWMGSYASSTPAEIVQLQAADLFAYELAKEFENLLTRPQDSMRWGLQQILQLVNYPFSMIRLYDRKELLRTILESGLQFRENTEEVGPTYIQQMSSQERMLKWLRDRAALKPRDIDIEDIS
jgi:hypothetical protein